MRRARNLRNRSLSSEVFLQGEKNLMPELPFRLTGRDAIAIVALFTFAAAARADGPASRPAPEFAEVAARGSVQFEPAETEQDVPEHFRLTAHDFEFQSRAVRGGPKFRMLRVTFPSPVTTDVVENNTVHGEYFQPADRKSVV